MGQRQLWTWAFLGGCVALLGVSPARAAIPYLLTHHGSLTQGGNPVSGNTLLTFRLYDSEAAVTPFWEESLSVTCTDGYYSALLGQGVAIDPADIVAAGQLWLGIVVNAGAELSPRLRVSSVPYAIAADSAVVASALDCTGCVLASQVAFSYAGSNSGGGPALGLECSGECVNTPEIANAAVTQSKLAAGAVGLAQLAACPGPNQFLVYSGSAWQCQTSFPAGSIIMWSGALGNIPVGWQLCDGSNGTPDMRGRFPVGYNAGAADYNTIGNQGGAQTPTTSSAGAHTHSCSSGNANPYGAGGYCTGIQSAGAHTHTVDVRPPYKVVAFICKT